MNNKTSLVLVEQLIMVLIFAMAAAICLKIFVYSSNLSKKNEAISQAAVLAQNCAEELKKSHGEKDENFQTQIGEWKYRGIIRKQETGMKGLGGADIVIYGTYRKTEEELFSISVAWQEVSCNE